MDRDAPSTEGDRGSSVGTSLEHLIAGSQGVITKRLDLAVLEGEEFLSRALERAALLGVGVILLAGACLAATNTLVLTFVPESRPQLRMAVFAILNVVAALGAVQLARRRGRRARPSASRTEAAVPAREPARAPGGN